MHKTVLQNLLNHVKIGIRGEDLFTVGDLYEIILFLNPSRIASPAHFAIKVILG